MIRSAVAAAILAFATLAMTCGGAQASSYFTYVSSTGTNAGACTRAAPCRTIQFALGQTFTNGEVHVMDAGDYGAVSITRGVKMLGVPGATLNRLANAPVVNIAAGTGPVDISGFTIDAGYNPAVSVDGIRSFSSNLTVRDCVIRNMSLVAAINITAAGVGTVTIEDTSIDNSNRGIQLSNSTGTLDVNINRVTVRNSAQSGIYILGGISVAISDSASSGSRNSNGIHLNAASSKLFVANTKALNNFGYGIVIVGGTASSSGDNSVAGNGFGEVFGTLTKVGPF